LPRFPFDPENDFLIDFLGTSLANFAEAEAEAVSKFQRPETPTMGTQPRLSIGAPIYNGENFIGQL
jgi:hypothetical protein